MKESSNVICILKQFLSSLFYFFSLVSSSHPIVLQHVSLGDTVAECCPPYQFMPCFQVTRQPFHQKRLIVHWF